MCGVISLLLCPKLTSLENAARRREEEMNTLTEEYQALRVELEDTTADMDFARSQLCVVQAKLDAQTDALCKSENALQVLVEATICTCMANSSSYYRTPF